MAEQQADLFVSLDTTFGALASVAVRSSSSRSSAARPWTPWPAPRRGSTLRRRHREPVRRPAARLESLRPERQCCSRPSRPGSRRCRPRRSSTPSSTRRRRRCSTSPRTRRRRRASSRSTTSSTPWTRRSFVAPAQSVCNYGSLLFRNVSSLLSLGDGIGTWQRFIALRAARRARTTRAARPRRRPTAEAAAGQLPPLQPLPEHGGAGADPRMRGGERDLHRRPAGDRQRARQPGDAPPSSDQHLAEVQEAEEGQEGQVRQEEEGQELMPPVEIKKKDYDERIYHRRPPGSTGMLGADPARARRRRHLPRGDQGAALRQPTTRSTRCSRTPPTSARTPLCGSPASTSARSSASRASATPPRSPSPSTTRAGRSARTPTVKIRPRIFLEGNFFLDLQPGSPSSPELDDGGTIPITQTSTAVQLDEILTSLQAPDRENLHPARGLRHGAQPRPDRGRGRRPGSRRSGQDRGPGDQRSLQVRRPRRARHGDRQRGAARHRATRPLGPARGLRPDLPRPDLEGERSSRA